MSKYIIYISRNDLRKVQKKKVLLAAIHPLQEELFWSQRGSGIRDYNSQDFAD
jgi:hypothetical protein